MLGHRYARIYASCSRAVHWDGRDEVDEHVASGLYFYTIQAGSFTATRKMIVAR
jgi:hypothetical protein